MGPGCKIVGLSGRLLLVIKCSNIYGIEEVLSLPSFLHAWCQYKTIRGNGWHCFFGSLEGSPNNQTFPPPSFLFIFSHSTVVWWWWWYLHYTLVPGTSFGRDVFWKKILQRKLCNKKVSTWVYKHGLGLAFSQEKSSCWDIAETLVKVKTNSKFQKTNQKNS